MATYTKLASRLNTLPLILAGPILRRTEPGSVTVWVALKEARTVTLRIYSKEVPGFENGYYGFRSTVKLGKNLHIVAVRAFPHPPSADLDWGKKYYYNLFFTEWQADPINPAAANEAENLQAPRWLTKDGLNDNATLEEHLIYQKPDPVDPLSRLPNFILPPADLNKLNLFHSSCRKPHGEGEDMLAHLDRLVGNSIKDNDPESRPHLLFLTGDQIYADDVADVLLELIRDAESALIGSKENLPGINDQPDEIKTELEKQLDPGKRQDLAEDIAGFTSDEASSHLVTFGEFCMMYLFAWSPVVWPPGFEALGLCEYFFSHNRCIGPLGNSPLAEVFEDQKSELNRFLGTKENEILKKVRRVLANTPTYMIFDDHEVTDDWNLHSTWCVNVYQSKLGKRVVENALLAYSVFQAWGNTPLEFMDDKPGSKILKVAQLRRNQKIDEPIEVPELGLPDLAQLKEKGLMTPEDSTKALPYHYTVDGPRVATIEGGEVVEKQLYRVLVLDTRTHRFFPGGGGEKGNKEPPELVSAQSMAKQIPNNPLSLISEVTFIVSPTPVKGIDWIESAATIKSTFRSKESADYEYWSVQKSAVIRLIESAALQGVIAGAILKVRNRIIFLSGDVHYGFAARMRYVDKINAEDRLADAVFAQLTASSLKNQDSDWFGTITAQNIGYNFLPWGDFKSEDKISEGGRLCSEYIMMETLRPDEANQSPPQLVGPENNLEKLKNSARNHEFYADRWANGKEIVGYNNLGHITLETSEADLNIIQTLYWISPEYGNLETRYVVSLAFDEVDCD